jgi:hypothetical protein
MKRIGSVVGAATLVVMATALPALAGYAPGPPPPGGTHGGTAFTGSTGISVGVVLLVVTAIVGLTALLIGRRLSAQR